MKNYFLVLVFAISTLTNLIIEKPAQAQYAQYSIFTCSDLQNIGIGNNYLSGQFEPLNGSYALAYDINCSDTKNWNNGKGFLPIGQFTGSLDGQGHSIKNLYINNNQSNIAYIGLFSILYGSVTHLSLIDVNITATGSNLQGVGALAGELASGSISNVRVSGTINSNALDVGGVVGQNTNPTHPAVPNLIDQVMSAVTMNIASSPYSFRGIGGIIGQAYNLSIDRSSYTGNMVINSPNNSGPAIGGLAGFSADTFDITDSYSVLNIDDSNAVIGTVGGLIGNVTTLGASIKTSYSIFTKKLPCNAGCGGLVGSGVNTNLVSDSYWNNDSGIATSYGSDPSYGKSTFALTSAATFSGWDFINTWIADNKHYPILIWQEQDPQITLWGTFSAASQINTFEPASPLGTINWTNLNSLTEMGVNWSRLLELSKPPVWTYTSAIPQQGYLNSVNWYSLNTFSNSTVNWSDIIVFTGLGINWASANPMIKAGINWEDWNLATNSGILWKDISKLSHQGINWTSIGTTWGGVNWSNLAEMTHKGINWGTVSELSYEGTNWGDVNILNSIPLTITDFNTLKTIGVDQNYPARPTSAQLTLYLNSNGQASGTFTSFPAGISCSTVSSAGCTATFPLNQTVILNFTTNNNSVVSNWGGCNVINANSCDVSLDQDISINIALNPPANYALNITKSGNGGGTVYCNGITCPASVAPGTKITFTQKPNYGSYFTGFGGQCAGNGGSPSYNCTIFNIKANVSITANFSLLPPPAPAGLKVNTISNNIVLSWSPSAAISYNVYRAKIGLLFPIYSLISNVTTNYFTDTTMPEDGAYAYSVTAVYYPNIESPKSNIFGLYWIDQNFPKAPAGLNAVEISGHVALSWMATQGTDYYNVNRATVNKGVRGPFVIVRSVPNDPDSKTILFTDTTVTKGSLYYYTVTAVNLKGIGPNSTTVTISIK